MQSAADSAARDAAHPNTIPYRSTRSAGAHLLALPATLWRLAWTPLGESIIWIEQKRIQERAIGFFLNDARSGGFFPLISIGGSTGFGAGLMLFHNNLFDRGKQVQASFIYSTADNNSASVAYTDTSLFGSKFFFNLEGGYFNDADENLYVPRGISDAQLRDASLGANRSSEDDESSYAIEQADAVANFGYALSGNTHLGIVSSFARIDTGPGEDDEDQIFPPRIPGLGTTSLFAIGGALTFNFSDDWPRTNAGTVMRLSYTYHREVNGERFEFSRYRAEVRQFVSLPLLAANRRLALRGIFEKLDRLNDRQVPFYELSTLGSSKNLRGFDQDRFRGRGALLFNIEYRYPVWDYWDAVVFIDEGQVFDDTDELRIGEFKRAIGTGLRFMTANGFIMRAEVGFSSEQVRFLFQISPNF